MATIIKTQPSLGYKRSTALKLPDGRIGVLRIDRATWDPTQTWRHPKGWLAEYESEGAWLHAMDRRREHKLPPPPKKPSAWINYVKYTQGLVAGRTYVEAMRVAKEAYAKLDRAEKARFKSATYRPAVATVPVPAPVVPVVAEPKPAGEPPKYSKSFQQTKATSGTFPAGEYYIGDLCYGMADDVYDGVWGDTFGYDTGVYKSTDHADQMFAMGGTGGDGAFPGSDGNEYSVDAGIIGIMSTSLMKKTPAEFLEDKWYSGPPARIYTFKNPVRFEFDEAEVKFTFTDGETWITIGHEEEDDY